MLCNIVPSRQHCFKFELVSINCGDWLDSQLFLTLHKFGNKLFLEKEYTSHGKWSQLQKSERRKATKKNIKNQCLFSSSLLQKSERRKNEKNIESLIFVWFSHFNYLWRMGFVNSRR